MFSLLTVKNMSPFCLLWCNRRLQEVLCVQYMLSIWELNQFSPPEFDTKEKPWNISTNKWKAILILSKPQYLGLSSIFRELVCTSRMKKEIWIIHLKNVEIEQFHYLLFSTLFRLQKYISKTHASLVVWSSIFQWEQTKLKDKKGTLILKDVLLSLIMWQ